MIVGILGIVFIILFIKFRPNIDCIKQKSLGLTSIILWYNTKYNKRQYIELFTIEN